MKRLKSILTVLLIFGCGLFIGGILGGAATLHDFVNRTFIGGPVKIRSVLLQRAKQDLKLDEDQAHQFWEILTETGAELKQAADPVRPEIEAVLARSEARLRAVLKPDQSGPFEKYMNQARTRWQDVLDSVPVKAGAKPSLKDFGRQPELAPPPLEGTPGGSPAGER